MVTKVDVVAAATLQVGVVHADAAEAKRGWT